MMERLGRVFVSVCALRLKVLIIKPPLGEQEGIGTKTTRPWKFSFKFHDKSEVSGCSIKETAKGKKILAVHSRIAPRCELQPPRARIKPTQSAENLLRPSSVAQLASSRRRIPRPCSLH